MKYAHRRRLFPEALVKLMIIDMCRAFVLIHASAWIHCDVKPGNVVMSSKYFKVIDFGISEWTCDVVEEAALGVSKGTKYFMAPEVLDEDWQVYGHFTDVWGVGVMAFLMMSMKSELIELPRIGTNIGRQGLNEHFVHSRYSADLQLLVYRMVSIDYRDRPSAAEILQ